MDRKSKQREQTERAHTIKELREGILPKLKISF